MNYARIPGEAGRTTADPFTEWEHHKAMTQHAAYKWRGELYCEQDIVAVLTEEFPWYVWRDQGGDPTADDAETELDEIAAMFRINRDAPSHVELTGFPERLGYHHPGFCALCRRWFDHDD